MRFQKGEHHGVEFQPKMESELDDNARQVVLGGLLGDGHIKIKKRYKNATYEESKCLKQREYARWKAQKLNFTYFSKPRTVKGGGIPHLVGKTYSFVAFESAVDPYLTKLRKRWYPNGVKILPVGALRELRALGMAVWYMDDGYFNYQTKTVSLLTCSFSEQENLRLKWWFKNRFGLNPSLRRKVDKYYLEFSVVDSNKFLLIVREWIVPISCMVYKLGPLHPDNTAKLEAENKTVRERNLARYHRQKTELTQARSPV